MKYWLTEYAGRKTGMDIKSFTSVIYFPKAENDL